MFNYITVQFKGSSDSLNFILILCSYRRVKSGLVNFLSIGNIQACVGKMDELVKTSLVSETKGKDIWFSPSL